MIHPTFAQFSKLARRGNLVALRLDMPADLETPVSAFLKVAGKEPCAFLLESAEQEERIGRYSFIGFDPAAVLTDRGEPDVLSRIEDSLGAYHLANPEGLPSFAGGFVGFLGYENVTRFERVRLSEKNGLEIHNAVFFLVKDFVLFDHFKKTLSVICLSEIQDRSSKGIRRSYARAGRRIQKIEERLRRGIPRRIFLEDQRKPIGLKANLSRVEFLRRVRRIKGYIRAGDCIQVVFSQRFYLGKVKDDFEIYRALRSINPSPYMFYFRYRNLRLIGSSPELLVKKTGSLAEVRPIAGTRPRGETPLEDTRLEQNLRNSPKEMAEHLMLVDLGRNDLGRVCDFKTVRVNHFAYVERYSHVMHLVSGVTGRLRAGKDAFDLLQATFPAGTVTGAPKIRAMEIIDELEPEKRGPYGGALGYFSLGGDMDMCITIRTIVVIGGEAYVQAGAGVVYDSTPQREYTETANKAKALVQAVEGLRGGRRP